MTEATGQDSGATVGLGDGGGAGRTDRHPDEPTNDATPVKAYRQAVIVVHGMGEPIPLGTLRGFIETMWCRNPNLSAWYDAVAGAAPQKGAAPGVNPVWYRPDFRTGSREMARFVTRKPRDVHGAAGLRTDFHELYWADLTATNTWQHFKDWLDVLLLRWPSRVPKAVFGLWLVLWCATLLFGAAAAISTGLVDQILKAVGFCPLPRWLWFAALALNGLFLLALRSLLVSFFGDVARYVRAVPANITVRDATRARGLELLRSLHQSAVHERIIIVGHSLGSIVAYDLVRLYWEEFRLGRNLETETETLEAVKAVEHAARRLNAAVGAAPNAEADAFDVERDALRAAQRRLQRLLAVAPGTDGQGEGERRQPTRWLISDLVTVGSPLTHAEFLMATDLGALRQQQQERQFPCCPPTGADLSAGFVYPAMAKVRLFDQGAVFAAVRWTNVYDQARWLLAGDPISGPLAPVWGVGVKDVKVAAPGVAGSRIFTHTGYWDPPLTERDGRESPHLEALRAALALVDPPPPAAPAPTTTKQS